jgi:drug/metabolite transporter (DMT)-like permease
MSWEQLGQLAALGTAILWTLSSLVWTSVGKDGRVVPMSFLRLVLTVGMLMVYGRLTRGLWLPSDASADTWLYLAASGFAGFFVCDILLFESFMLIGTRLGLLIYSIVPPLTAVLEMLLPPHGMLTAWQWFGMAVTLAGVVWVVLEGHAGPAGDGRPPRWKKGVILAVAGSFAAVIGTVLTRVGLGDYDAGAATFIRVLGGMVGYIPLLTLARRWNGVAAMVADRRLLGLVALGSFVGPFAGVVLMLVALRHCPAGVVTTIIATMPVLILPFSVLLHRERVGFRAIGGAILSLAGVAILALAVAGHR